MKDPAKEFYERKIVIFFLPINLNMCSKDGYEIKKIELSRDMMFPSMWYVLLAKAQTSLRIRAA